MKMISIEDYQDFLIKIKCLEADVQEKLISILNKRLEGILPKKIDEEEKKYDYTYKLDENLIPFLDKFDEYFYPQNLIDNKIIDQINNLVSELQQIALITQQINNDSFKTISELVLVASKMGKTIFDTYKKVEHILLINKKDVLINHLLKHIEYIDQESIHFILENNYGIDNFMDKIKYKVTEKIQEIVIKNNFKVSFDCVKLIRNVEKKLSIIQWYIYANEMKFLDKINILEFKTKNLFLEKLSVYETKFIEKKTVELDNGNIFEVDVNLLEEYQNNAIKIENELIHNFNLRKSKLNSNEVNNQIFEEELEKIITKYKLSQLNEYDVIVDQLRINKQFIKLDNIIDSMESIFKITS